MLQVPPIESLGAHLLFLETFVRDIRRPSEADLENWLDWKRCRASHCNGRAYYCDVAIVWTEHAGGDWHAMYLPDAAPYARSGEQLSRAFPDHFTARFEVESDFQERVYA